MDAQHTPPDADTHQALRGVWAGVLRAAYVASMASFALPFVVVRSCSTDRVSQHTGVELVTDGGVDLLVVFLTAAVLLALTFRPLRLRPVMRGLVHAARALVAGITFTLMILAVALSYLFDEETALVGMWICGASWLLVYVLSLCLAWPEHVRVREQVQRAAEATSLRRIATRILLGVLALSLGSGVMGGQPGLGNIIAAALWSVFFLLPLGVAAYFVILSRALRRDPPPS